MKLTVGLNTKSIKNAVKSLETAQKQLNDKMVEELLIACCERIIQRANENLDELTIGSNVLSGIKGSWIKSEVQGGKITLTNTWHKAHGKFEMAAVYVEFGVGVKGDDSHPEASKAGYQYNMPSSSKQDDGTWGFYTNMDDLDLPSSAFEQGTKDFKGGRLKVVTRGTQATRFLYNAVMDFANKKEAEALWQEIKAKYWS